MRGYALLVAMMVGPSCVHAPLLDKAALAGEGPMTIVQLDPDVPTSVLRQVAEPVDPKDPALPLLLERMAATLEKSGGVGIAAPQVGISKRVFLIKHGTRPKGQPTRVEAYLNPRVEEMTKPTDGDYEACLSIAGIGGLVPRATRVRFSFDVVGGGRREITLVDWDARIFQHELDHIDGHVYLDRLEGERLPIDEMRRRRDALHEEKGWIPAPSR